jgi:hypothetical protein
LKKIIILSILIISLSACCQGNEPMTQEKKKKETARVVINTLCLNGVEYYFLLNVYYQHGFGYMSPKFNRDGTIATCNVVVE